MQECGYGLYLHPDKIIVGMLTHCLSDTQLGMLENNAEFSRETVIIEKAIAEINRLNPAFVAITGDLVNEGGDEIQIKEIQRLLGLVKKSIPVYCVPGNHDVGHTVSENLLSLYRSNFNCDRFSILYNDTRLIGINSQLIWAKHNELEDEQFQWLENELKKSLSNRFRFIFAHHPLFVQSIDENDAYENIPVDRRTKYIDLFEKYNVQFMFAGHLHRNNISKTGNLTIIVTNAICVSHSPDPPGLSIIKIYPEKVIHNYYSLDMIPEKVDL